MISAAVKGLARLAYEFSDLVSSAYKLLPSTFLLLQRKNREIIKVCSLSSLWPHNLLMVISLYFIFCTASLMFCGCLWCRLIWVCWKYWWPNQKLKACKHTWPAWWKACWSGKIIPKIILKLRFVLLFIYHWFWSLLPFWTIWSFSSLKTWEVWYIIDFIYQLTLFSALQLWTIWTILLYNFLVK